MIFLIKKIDFFEKIFQNREKISIFDASNSFLDEKIFEHKKVSKNGPKKGFEPPPRGKKPPGGPKTGKTPKIGPKTGPASEGSLEPIFYGKVGK